MPFDPQQTEQQITYSMGAMLLLHSSCQALIQDDIQQSSSAWYVTLNVEMGEAQNLVVGWRQNGFLYFQQEILQEIQECGQAFLDLKPDIDGLFEQIEQQYSASTRQQIVNMLSSLDQPVVGMIGSLDGYLDKLAGFQKSMEGPEAEMRTSIAKIQAEEAQIQAQIAAINAKIASLQQQIAADRDAIARAKAAEDRGTLETIFGIVLAPFTGGISLILAGIGVASIADAEEQINQLQSTISASQSEIANDQRTLSADQQQIATLNGLLLSVSTVANDAATIGTALGGLRTTWSTLQGSLSNAVHDVQQAQTSDAVLVAKVFFDAACQTWQDIVKLAASLADANEPQPRLVWIGK